VNMPASFTILGIASRVATGLSKVLILSLN
jgi:hypothetical protein